MGEGGVGAQDGTRSIPHFLVHFFSPSPCTLPGAASAAAGWEGLTTAPVHSVGAVPKVLLLQEGDVSFTFATKKLVFTWLLNTIEWQKRQHPRSTALTASS